MASISSEQPPIDTEDNLREYLSRMFTGVNNALSQDNFNNPLYVMPTKFQVGRQYYFGAPVLPDITDEGLWIYKSTGWAYLG